MKLTKERALELHRKMWGDMQNKFGNNPSEYERSEFKRCWIFEHSKDIPEIRDCPYILNDCFLCEFVWQKHPNSVTTYECKDLCPIDWSSLTNELWRPFDFRRKGYPNTCMFGSSKNGFKETWQTESIDKILLLPEKEN